MGNNKEQKTKEERLKEGMEILNKFRESGVKHNSLGFQELQSKISLWVSSGISWEGTINFPDYERIAEVKLPKYNNRYAELLFKRKMFH